uniref:Uncharacterized protein n=1 Tax=Anguilla anguilla TaxID=7936 RepID=A0A0E9XEZ4_ANGAN
MNRLAQLPAVDRLLSGQAAALGPRSARR